MGNCIKTREVGEHFCMGGVLYEVVESAMDYPCAECSLQGEDDLICRGDVGITGLCYHGMRSDNKQVIFKDVSKADKPKESLLNGDFTGETSEVWPLNEKLK